MTTRVVITGRGIVNPLGNKISKFKHNLYSLQNGIKKIERYDTSKNRIKVAGIIDNFDESVISRRVNHKIDTFIRYAVYAAQQAMEDSGFKECSNYNSYRTGVFVGNNSGGWDISERGFKELYIDGAEFVNPWQATAWFPAAAQGYITILNKIHGYSKSFVADRASGAMSLKFAYESIKSGFNDVVVCGGTEAPITKLATVCYSQTKDLYESEEAVYYSLYNRGNGIVLSEGSSFLVLEELEHALSRGAKIYGEIVGSKSNRGDYIKCMDKLMSGLELTYSNLDVFLPEACGVYECDKIEDRFIDDVLSDNTIISTPKQLFGHQYGASTVTDVLIGTMYIEDSICIVDTRNNNMRVSSVDEVDTILVSSRTREGINVGTLLKKYRS